MKFKSGSDEVVSPEIFPWGFEFCQKSMQWLPVQKNGTLFHTEMQNSENVKKILCWRNINKGKTFFFHFQFSFSFQFWKGIIQLVESTRWIYYLVSCEQVPNL